MPTISCMLGVNSLLGYNKHLLWTNQTNLENVRTKFHVKKQSFTSQNNATMLNALRKLFGLTGHFGF